MDPSSHDRPANGKPAPDLKLAGVVHDLNNVFQTLVEVADLLTYESVDPNGAKLSAAILRSVERGKRITESLVADGLVMAGPHSVGLGIPLEQVLSNAIAFVEDTQISGRGPSMRVSCDLEPGISLGGESSGGWAWERVFINLFMNSLRAMPDGGGVFVSARRAASRPGSIAEIRVRDEGPGIAADLLDCLFEPHVSGSASTGLGLHIVKTIVESKGGTVEAVRKTQHPGAEFLILAPMAQSEEVNIAVGRPAHA
ncbi:MAG: HAMP domain-containing sensor histidine kinase [Acidobacteriota bacterium]